MASSTNAAADTTDAKKQPDIACTITGGLVTFTFGDGSEPIIIHASHLSSDIREAALAHGLKQKIGDAGAISRNPDTGRSATIADKRAAMQAVADRLLAGQWNKVREGGAGAQGGLLLSALCELKPGKTREQLQAYLDKLSDKEQAALRASAPIKPIIERIKAERAKVPANADAIAADLLAGLDDESDD